MKRLAPVLVALGLALVVSWWRGPVVAPPYRERRILMDTLVTITAYAPGGADPTLAVDAAFREMARIEGVFSSYLPDAPVARLNAAGHLTTAPAEVRAVLAQALALHKASRGWYDPTLGELSSLWGFGPPLAGAGTPGPREADESRAPPSEDALVAAVTRGGADQVEVDGEAVRLRRGGQLDLGGFAKGYAVDRAVRVLAEAGLAALVDAGGDMACTGPKPGGVPWSVGVHHPSQPDALLGTIPLRSGAVATSGDYERTFSFQGVHYHHLLSPRDGRPARTATQVTARAETCAEADAWATALFVAPDTEGLAPEGVQALWIGAHGTRRELGDFPMEPAR